MYYINKFKFMIALFIIILLTAFTFAQTDLSEKNWKTARSLPFKTGKDLVKVKVQKTSANAIALQYIVPEGEVYKLRKRFGRKQTVEFALGNAPLTGKVGEPMLPVIPAKVVIPEGREIDEIIVKRGGKVEVEGKHVVEHGRALYPLVAGVRARASKRNRDVYRSDNAFLGRAYDLVSVQKKRGVSVVIINIHPVTYHPKSGRLYYYNDIQVEVKTKPADKAMEKKLRKRMAKQERFMFSVENPEEIGALEERGAADSVFEMHGIVDPSKDFRYVIITNETIKSASTDVMVNHLIAQRQSQGLTATVVTVEEIYSSYGGRDNAEKVRNFIVDAYNNWGTDYVLLGGDENIVPMRKFWNDPWVGSGYADHIPSDMYYACLDGDFNFDGDQYWGEKTDGPAVNAKIWDGGLKIR